MGMTIAKEKPHNVCIFKSNIYVGPNMRNDPVYIMDVPISILGPRVPVWILGPVNYGLHLYGDRGLSKFLD